MATHGWQVLNGELTYLDLNGDPLTAGRVFLYVPGTTTPKDTWVDQTLSVANPNPVLLDQAGRATIWGSGLYRQVVIDQFGNLQWDLTTGSDPGFDDLEANTATISGELTVGAGLVVKADGADITGPVYCDGLIVRADGANITGDLTVSGSVTGSLAVTGINLSDPGTGTSIFNTALGVPHFYTIPGQGDTLIVDGPGRLDVRADLGVGGNLIVAGTINGLSAPLLAELLQTAPMLVELSRLLEEAPDDERLTIIKHEGHLIRVRNA